MNDTLRIAITLHGKPDAPDVQTKYGLLFAALARRATIVDVVDASLKGSRRYWNLLRRFHPHRRRWRERAYKNPTAFRWRSQRVTRNAPRADVVLQLGALFDSSRESAGPPVVIYTDYTAALSARKPDAGRSPLSGAAQARWLALEKQTYRRAAHLCVRSDLTRRSLIDDYQVAPECITVVGGGVNFEPLPEMAGANGPSMPTALFIGKEFRRKGGDLLLHAFARARQHYPRARLLLVTNERAPQPATPGVTWIAPTWDRTAIAALYRRADLFVLPSRLETWGDVLLEAMAFGLPCIGVADDAMGEIIAQERSGLLVPPGDENALTAALIRLFADPALRRALGAAGRYRVEEQFRWIHVAERLLDPLTKAARQLK